MSLWFSSPTRWSLVGLCSVACSCLSLRAEAPVIRWARQFGTSGSEVAFAVSCAGNAIYVAGYISNGAFPGFTNAGGSDAFVAKFDPQGNRLWVRQFGSSGDDTALGIAADEVAVYVVGNTSGVLPGQSPVGNTDAFVRRHTPDGEEVWTRQFGTAGVDEALGVVTVHAGLYVAGRTTGAFAGQSSGSPGTDDAFVARFDDKGDQWWVRQFGSTGGDRAYGAAADASGVYIAGYTQAGLVSPSAGTDAFLRKYDDAGNVLWTRQISSQGTANEIAYGVAARHSAVFVCGNTTGVFAGQSRISGADGWAQRYDPNGVLQWTRQFGSVMDDVAYGIAVGQWVYITGTAGQFDAMVERLALHGGEPGYLQFAPETADYAFAVAVDDTGAYLAGTKFGDSLGQVALGGGDAFLVKVAHPPMITGVAEAFTGQAGVAATTWVSIYGENLSETSRSWDGAIRGSQLPKVLDNVSVDINGRAATVYYVSPRQVNILAPLDDTVGNVGVTLRNEFGATGGFPVRKAEVLPAFYAPFGDARGLAVTAVALDGTLLGNRELDPRVARAARPGELVLFFGTGFGATIPPVPVDQLFIGAPAVAASPRITIGGKVAAMIGSGNLVSPGLYQFNLTIPDLPDGDHAMLAEVGVAKSAASVFLSVHR